MPLLRETLNGKPEPLTWNDFKCTHQDPGTKLSATELVSCLAALLDHFGESEFITYLVLPSPSSLSLYFQLNTSEVHQILNDLNKLGYQIETSNLDAPIILMNPTIGKNRTQR